MKDDAIQHIEDASNVSPTNNASTAPIKPAAATKAPIPEIYEAVGHGVFFTLAQETAVLRKIDRRVLPIMLGAYFLQQLDKSTLSYSSVFNIQRDAHLHGLQYSWLGSILYVAQLVMQPVGAIVLVKLPLGKVISFAVFMWGVCLCGMAGSKNFGALLATRFLLGTFESLIGPSLIAVTQMWWRRSEQTNRLAIWNSMNGVAFILGSLSTYGLGHIHSANLFSYQVIFLFCGCITFLFAAVAFIFMPDSPMEAKFWNEGQDLIAVERVRSNQMGIMNREWRWDHVWECLLDVKTWCWFCIVCSISIPSGGIGTFGPLIVKSFGFDQFKTILFNTPFGAVQIVATLGAAWLATKIKSKGVVISLCAIPCIVGAVLILTLERTAKNRGVLLFAYYLLSFMSAITPTIWSWAAQNTGGDTKRKCTTGIVFIGMCLGNVIGPLLYNSKDAPLYHKGLVANLAMYCLMGVFPAVIMLYLRWLNRKHGNMRVAVGKSRDVIDQSMLKKSEIAENEKLGNDGVPEGEGIRDNGLLDVPDLKNEDFIYVY